MVIFLTSSFIEYQPMEEYKPRPVLDENGFVDNLKRFWQKDANFLAIASDPDAFIANDHMTRELLDAFSLSDFSIKEMKCFDHRSTESIKEALQWADVVFLAGGHGPTENAFIHRIELAKYINDASIFDGIFLGLSAGAINAADEVYIIPEMPDELDDPNYKKIYTGLGFTSISMIPHSQFFASAQIKGKNIIDDVAVVDSYSRPIYLIPDGSYFVIRNGNTEFFGYGMILENGEKRPLHAGIINSDNQKMRLQVGSYRDEISKSFDSIVDSYYEWVLAYDIKTGEMDFWHISPFMLEHDIVPIRINTFQELVSQLSEKLVVEEEKQPVIEQLSISIILDEVQRFGQYVRTMHLDTEQGIKAVSMRITPLNGQSDTFTVCLTDITLILDHDWMTDVYSRSGFIAKTSQLLKDPAYQSGYSIGYTNIQGFKGVNDMIGSSAGDIVLFQQRDSVFRCVDPLFVARLENDHFAFFTKTDNLTKGNLDELCNQIFTYGDIRLPLQIRCGIYHIEDATKTVNYMLDRAKLAENTISPSLGAPYAICDRDMSREYINQRRFVTELDEALANHEFMTYFQPIVDAKSGEIVSAEALIRWNHPTYGMVPPGQFVPVLEKEGLISKLDNFMIQSVLAFNLERKQRGQKTVPCAVNLSRVDFYDKKLLETLKDQIGQFENVKEILKLEVTESAYADLETDAMDFLTEMKKLGLSLLLDDFGCGMSSLATLESFAFDTIKLDMGFVQKIGKNKKTEEIIKHVVGLAHDIGSNIIAEGVESEEQLNFLKLIGCDAIQGYYFYKPMSVDDFSKLLA